MEEIFIVEYTIEYDYDHRVDVQVKAFKTLDMANDYRLRLDVLNKKIKDHYAHMSDKLDSYFLNSVFTSYRDVVEVRVYSLNLIK